MEVDTEVPGQGDKGACRKQGQSGVCWLDRPPYALQVPPLGLELRALRQGYDSPPAIQPWAPQATCTLHCNFPAALTLGTGPLGTNAWSELHCSSVVVCDWLF